MNNIVLSATQAFQLAAIGPCLFIAILLLLSIRNVRHTFLPAIYFIALSSTFLIPLVKTVFGASEGGVFYGALLLLENMLPELSFLLIIQFATGARPKPVFWLVLAIPLIGGSPFIYLMLNGRDVCMADDVCYQTAYLLKLYRVLGASLIFMLLVFFISRSLLHISHQDPRKRTKYWLIITLILFNIIQLAVDLFEIAGSVLEKDAVFVRTMVSVTFVYLVLSSVFRVFSESFGLKPIQITPRLFTLKDQDIVDKVESLLRDVKPYRKIGFKRRTMSDMVGVKEHQLSKAINQKYGKSFSELMNEYRIREAQMLLVEKNDPVTAISYDTGFSSIASFNRVFKQYTGLSPTAYRSSQRKLKQTPAPDKTK